MNRRLSRTLAMQALYEWDFRPEVNPLEIAKRNAEAMEEEADEEYLKKVLAGVVEKRAQLDGKITAAAQEWPIEQISIIDKTILRLAIYELLYDSKVPPKVAINEAVELAKIFGGENSSKFINGVLGTIYRASDRYDPSQDEKIKKQKDEEGDKSEKERWRRRKE